MRLPRQAIALAWSRRASRIALIVLAVSVPVLVGAFVWLRHSPLVAVDHVRIAGVHGPDAHAIDAALTDAARGMSTLDAHTGALLAAVSQYPVVREVRAVPSFPHGMSIEVVEQPPVASLVVDGVRTAVAADGVVLGAGLLSADLPTVASSLAPAPGRRVRSGTLLGVLSVLGAAPTPLRKLIERSYTGPKGITAIMSGGLAVYFGDSARPHAKWMSLARVLADPSSAGASYVDVRLPERPAAGFPAGVVPPDASEGVGPGGEQSSGSESPIASLAAGLTAGSEASSSSTQAPEASSSTSSPPSPSSSSSEPSQEGGSASPSEGTAEAAGG